MPPMLPLTWHPRPKTSSKCTRDGEGHILYMQAVANDGQYDGNLPTAQMANSFIGLCTDTVPSEVRLTFRCEYKQKMMPTLPPTWHPRAKRHLQKDICKKTHLHDANLTTAQMANSFIRLCTDTVPSEVRLTFRCEYKQAAPVQVAAKATVVRRLLSSIGCTTAST